MFIYLLGAKEASLFSLFFYLYGSSSLDFSFSLGSTKNSIRKNMEIRNTKTIIIEAPMMNSVKSDLGVSVYCRATIRNKAMTIHDSKFRIMKNCFGVIYFSSRAFGVGVRDINAYDLGH